MKEEEIVKKQIATYLRVQYPNIIYRFDIAADLKLTIGSAIKSKRIHQHERGYPDLWISEPKGNYNGLYIEVKKDRSEVYTKKGILKRRWNKKNNSCHNQEQFDFLNKLNSKGYMAKYGFGFEETILIIDNYMKLSQLQS